MFGVRNQCCFKFVIGLLCLGLTLLSGSRCGVGSELVRQANSTLALPLEPYQYSIEDAFPGLTFDEPMAIVSAPGETNRLFIVERQGRIQVITNLTNPSKTLFLDISGWVDRSDEGGLLGLAFHPGYRTNRYFFVYYTLNISTSQGDGFHDRIARFEISTADPNQAMSNSEVSLITQFDESDSHNAGDLHFGPDGYLYVSLGDEGGGGDSLQNSQRIDKDFFSGILRIDTDRLPGSLPPNAHPASSTHYAIPPDNPFVGATSFNGSAVNPAQVRTEFWAVGFRNPWRFSFDSFTGQLYCGDVGENSREEIDLVVRGGNYGWNYLEGVHIYEGNPPAGTTFIEPILDYDRSAGRCVIGGVVYRGSRIPQLFGHYVFGDLDSGSIWALHYDGTNSTGFRQLTSIIGVCAFGQDPANQDILLVQAFGTVPIYRLVYNQDVGVPLPQTLADMGAFQDLSTLQPQPGIVPYNLNVPFWSDHAQKTRWFSVPDTNGTIGFSPTGNWSFPTGTVWIKHFDLQLTNGAPDSARRLETRFLVRNTTGVYGLTYRWGDSTTNAFLVPEEGMDETFEISDGGVVRTQVWRYPGRSECLRCHTAAGGYALGFNTFQLNFDHDYSGTVTNQVLALSSAGYFSSTVSSVDGLLAYVSASDESVSVRQRVRSYLGANCVQCHQPGGSSRASWDARLTTPLEAAGIVNGRLIDNDGNPDLKVVKPGSTADSMMFRRIVQMDSRHMPPLATSELNQEAIALLSRWITNDLLSITLQFSAGLVDYFVGADPVVLAPDASITSRLSLDGATLTVKFSANGAADDRLAVRHIGDGPDEIGVSGNFLSYSGAVMGTYSGGHGSVDPLVIDFDANATPAAAQAVLRNVTYHNVSTKPSALPRTVLAVLAAGDSESGQDSLIVSVRSVPAPHLGAVVIEADGRLRISFTGLGGRLYRVEASDTLDSWLTIGTSQTGPDGSAEFVDLRPEGLWARFYRLAWP